MLLVLHLITDHVQISKNSILKSELNNPFCFHFHLQVLRVNLSSWSDELISEARRLEEAGAINILLLRPTRGAMDLMVSSENVNTVLGMLDDSKAIYTVGETDSTRTKSIAYNFPKSSN